MLSIIICSRNKIVSKELIRNIDESVGTVYELVVVDNSNNDYTIF